MTTSSRKTGSVSLLNWRDIDTYDPLDVGPYFVLLANENKKWVRFGKKYPGLNRWYYSGHDIHATYSEGIDDDRPTHWAPRILAPWESDNV